MTKVKKQNALPCKFKKRIKGLLFHCREISDHKYWWSGKNFLNILSANWHLLKLWNSIKKNVWYLRSLEKLAIKIWFPFNFAKNLKDRYFVMGESKNLKLEISFLVLAFKKIYCRVFWNEIASSTARIFNNNWLLYGKFSETINLCRNIWLIENWKCQLFLFLK